MYLSRYSSVYRDIFQISISRYFLLDISDTDIEVKSQYRPALNLGADDRSDEIKENTSISIFSIISNQKYCYTYEYHNNKFREFTYITVTP